MSRRRARSRPSAAWCPRRSASSRARRRTTRARRSRRSGAPRAWPGTACRAIASEERAAFERLGAPLDSSNDVTCEWDRPIWQFPEFLTPVRPAVRDAALARMAELEQQIDDVLARLSDDEWGRRYGDGWTVRSVVDHLANGCGLFIRRLEPWPLDPEEAQRSAAADLRRGLDEHTDRPFVVDHFGSN